MDPSLIVFGAGARTTEDLVVERVCRLHAEARDDPALLARPVRLVVPSTSLRDHLSAVLVRRCGALAGVQVSTFFATALEILRADIHPKARAAGRGTALFGVLVRRFARLEPFLRDRLDGLADGYAVVADTVRDVLDAGFEDVHREALDELLAGEARGWPATEAEVARARALLRVAAATQEALERLDVMHHSVVLRAARDVLEARGAVLLPSRVLLIHGFADATGVVGDFLESLLRVLGGRVYLDRPEHADHPTAHVERLAIRLSQVAKAQPQRESPTSPTRLMVDLVAAPDPESEMREIARRIARLLAGGALPETIGLVARDLTGRGVLVRRHFRALGIPFSGTSPGEDDTARPMGPVGPVGRDLAVLRELLQRGPGLTIERWLDVLRVIPGGRGRPSLAADLRIAFFALGASRLEDLERTAVPEGDAHVLPMGDALEPLDAGGARATRREVASSVLLAVAEAGTALAEELQSWQGAAFLTFREHCARLRRLLDEHLAWTTDDGVRTIVDDALETLDVPVALALAYDEFLHLALAELAGRGAVPLGGHGGGVRVLDVMEARALTFEHLFVCGMERDAFPQPWRGDPLLPERLRRGLARLLPDLPVRSSGFDEERYLFAQLLSAAPRVTLSWPFEDTTGKALAPSPFVDSLRRAEGAVVESAPRLLAPEPEAGRPVDEELMVSALHGDRGRFAAVLPLAVEEVRGLMTADLEPETLARGRLAVLGELDPDRRTKPGRVRSRQLGPYFGFLGRLSTDSRRLEAADPRRDDLFVTTLESFAACPWQTFLRRVLRLTPMPDPLSSLPNLRGLLLGRLVHRVLEEIVTGSLGGRMYEGGAEVDWPEPEELDALLADAAERTLHDEGLGLKGLARAAAELARPYVEAARDLDWARGRKPRVGSVEVSESCRVRDRHGRPRLIRFKADRVDFIKQGGGTTLSPGGDQGGETQYTDYKTGSPRRARQDANDDLAIAIARGERLQAAAYVAAGAGAGRYLFLRPDLDADERILRVDASNDRLRNLFESSVRTLLAAWDDGVFFPRLVAAEEDVEPSRCAWCTVSEACLRRDSGSRGRLRRYAEARREEAAGSEDEKDVFLQVWEMASKAPG